jgi:F0F1-type ATP synthase assembly protein I
VTEVDKNPQTQDIKQSTMFKSELISFAYELGTFIVIPLVICLLAGIWFDHKFDTKPIGLFVGLFLSLITTSIAIKKKVRQFNP